MKALTVFKLAPVNPSPSMVGSSFRVLLEQTISGTGGHAELGPHVCGRAEVLLDGKLRIEILDTNAGRHAIAMIRDDLLDVVHWNGTVRLRVPGGAKDAAAAWKGLANRY